jgi:hypothetical protein
MTPLLPAVLLLLAPAPLPPAAAPPDAPAEIVFQEDFEHFDRKNWNEFGEAPEAVEVVDGGPTGRGKCVRITATLGENTGAHLYKMLEPGLDTCHLRFYVKFEREHDYLHHFVHLVGYNPPSRWPQGGAGERPRGDARFSTGIEPWGDWGKHPAPGAWNFYSYWCEMEQSRDGKFWGNSFAPKEPALVARDRWTCVEIMLKCNSTPEKSDGEQAFWIDGKEVGRWGGFRWRTSDELKVNGLWMLYYITDNAARQNDVKNPRKVNRVWFDDIAVAESYIGPLADKPRRAEE